MLHSTGIFRKFPSCAVKHTPNGSPWERERPHASRALGELTGKTARDDLVARIFERFCVGK